MTKKSTTHRLKILSEFYKPLIHGIKMFELRKNDRGFKVGDYLELSEITTITTGRVSRFKIVYILENFPGLEKGYCILGLGG